MPFRPSAQSCPKLATRIAPSCPLPRPRSGPRLCAAPLRMSRVSYDAARHGRRSRAVASRVLLSLPIRLNYSAPLRGAGMLPSHLRPCFMQRPPDSLGRRRFTTGPAPSGSASLRAVRWPGWSRCSETNTDASGSRPQAVSLAPTCEESKYWPVERWHSFNCPVFRASASESSAPSALVSIPGSVGSSRSPDPTTVASSKLRGPDKCTVADQHGCRLLGSARR